MQANASTETSGKQREDEMNPMLHPWTNRPHDLRARTRASCFRRTVFGLICAALFLFRATGSEAAGSVSHARPLPLEEAVNQAISRHPLLRGADARIEGAIGAKKEIEALQRPRLELQAVAVDGLSGAKGSGLGIQGVVSSQLVKDHALSLNVFQRIYDSGELGMRERSREHRVVSRESDRAAVRQQVGLDVVGAYIDLLRQEAVKKVLGQVIEERELFASVAAAGFQAGLRSELEVKLAEVQVLTARSRFTEAEANLEIGWARLWSSMGEIEASDRSLLPLRQELPEPPAFEGALASALDHRPELRSARASMSASDLEMKAVAASRKPLVRGFASGGLANTTLSGDDIEGAVGVAVKLPIDVSHEYRARFDQARSRKDEAEAALDTRLNDIVLEIRRGLVGYQNLVRQREVVASELEHAEAAFRIAESQYQAGLVSFADRVQAETTRLEIRTRFEQVRHDQVTAWAKLWIAQGRDLEQLVKDLQDNTEE